MSEKVVFRVIFDTADVSGLLVRGEGFVVGDFLLREVRSVLFLM